MTGPSIHSLAILLLLVAACGDGRDPGGPIIDETDPSNGGHPTLEPAARPETAGSWTRPRPTSLPGRSTTEIGPEFDISLLPGADRLFACTFEE